MEVFANIYATVLGLVIGSYLNVLIYRIPRKISTVKDYSACPTCKSRLTALDLVPLFSYLFLRGRCRHCHSKISPQYSLVEAFTALTFLIIQIRFGVTLTSVVYAVVCSSLITLAVIDFQHKIIPDRFHFIILICGFILAFSTKQLTWLNRFIGMFAMSVPVLVVVLLTGGMGEGDVKLLAVCGFLVGWEKIILTMLIASVAAALYSLFMVALKKANRKSEIAFGPFISLGVLISIFWGSNIIDAYISILP